MTGTIQAHSNLMWTGFRYSALGSRWLISRIGQALALKIRLEKKKIVRRCSSPLPSFDVAEASLCIIAWRSVKGEESSASRWTLA